MTRPRDPFRPETGERRKPQRLGGTGRSELLHPCHETEKADEDVAGIPAGRGRGDPFERTGHPAGGFDELTRLGALVMGRGGTGGGCPHRIRIEGTSRPLTGAGQHIVGQLREIGQGAGAGALGGVDRLPDLEASLGTGDHVRHTHYVTH